MQASEQYQNLYEIAMSIDSSLELREMLHGALSTILERLEVSAGLVIREKAEELQLEIAQALPASFADSRDCQNLMTKLRGQDIQQSSIRNLESTQYVYPLGDFGYLVLIAPTQVPENILWPRVLNDKLANACAACLANQELKLSHTRALDMNAELRNLAAEARTASNTKSDFLANMSHEFRTPLNAIIGMTELALESMEERADHASREEYGFLNLVKGSSDGLLNLVNDVLDFSQIESGKLSLERTDFSLRDVVENSVAILGTRANQKRLDLLCDIDPNVPRELYGDPFRLRQILINLLGNSIKFTEQGEAGVRVRNIGTNDAGQSLLEFTLYDSGIGISEEHISNLFSRFTQADNSSTRDYGGNGLGLSITKSLVELMEGRILYRRRNTKGTVFQLRIPFDVKSVEPSAPRLQGRVIAVLESAESLRRNLSRFLRRNGARVFSAPNSHALRQGLGELEARGVECSAVIMALELPELDAMTTLNAIMEQHGIPGRRILVYTAQENMTLFKKLEVADVHRKPLIPSQLLSAIQEIIQGPAESQETIPITSGIPTAPEPARLLLVDDDERNSLVACEYLRRAGYQVEAVNSGRQAIMANVDRNYDLILMDIQMPRMDGFAATAGIRKQERLRNSAKTPVIALTAHALHGYRELCLQRGMQDHITKPIDRIKLLNTVSNFLNPEPKVQAKAIGIEHLAPDFLAGIREELSVLEESLAELDFETVVLLAHRMSGTGLIYGFPPISILGQKLELAAEEHLSGRKDNLILCRNIRGELEDYVKDQIVSGELNEKR